MKNKEFKEKEIWMPKKNEKKDGIYIIYMYIYIYFYEIIN